LGILEQPLAPQPWAKLHQFRVMGTLQFEFQPGCRLCGFGADVGSGVKTELPDAIRPADPLVELKGPVFALHQIKAMPLRNMGLLQESAVPVLHLRYPKGM